MNKSIVSESRRSFTSFNGNFTRTVKYRQIVEDKKPSFRVDTEIPKCTEKVKS